MFDRDAELPKMPFCNYFNIQ